MKKIKINEIPPPDVSPLMGGSNPIHASFGSPKLTDGTVLHKIGEKEHARTEKKKKKKA